MKNRRKGDKEGSKSGCLMVLGERNYMGRIIPDFLWLSN